MKLKKKFKKQLDTATLTLNRPYYQTKQLEKIADEFAILFAEWHLNYYDNYVEGDDKSTKELLKIYKKEKGL